VPRPAKNEPWLGWRGGVAQFCTYDPKTKRTKRVGLRTRDRVEAAKRFIAFSQNGGASLDAFRDDGITVEQALEHYRNEHVKACDDRGRPNVADAGRQEYAIAYLKAFFGDRPLKEIGVPQCREYVKARRSGAVKVDLKIDRKNFRASDSTIRRELTVLRAASNHALLWKRINRQDAPTFELPADTEQESELAWYTKAELEKLFEVAEREWEAAALAADVAPKAFRLKAFVKLAYWWGARRGWVERLEVSQVDFELGVVDPYKPGEKRTKKRRFKMPIFPEIRPELEELCRTSYRGWLFGGPRIEFYHRFARLCGRAGLADKCNPHTLRHSRATHMLMDRENPYVVAKLLGDTLATVEKVYGHFSPEFFSNGGG
jgi:integrase